MIEMTFLVGALLIGTNDANLLETGSWNVVDDGVMGGRSEGHAAVEDGVLVFHGNLSLDNNGGFSSIRMPLQRGLAGYEGIRLRVRGDGRRYQVRLRHGNGFDGVAWRASFTAPRRWTTVELMFSEFEAGYRGRPVPDAGTVRPEDVGQIGFLLADKHPGPFRLEVAFAAGMSR